MNNQILYLLLIIIIIAMGYITYLNYAPEIEKLRSKKDADQEEVQSNQND